MALGLREIADILLREIYESLGENDYLDMTKVYESEKFVDFGTKVHNAMNYLEENGLIAGKRAEDGIVYYVSLTTKGILYCEGKGWHQINATLDKNNVTERKEVTLGLREISILLLEVISKFHENDPYASGIDFNEILNSEGLKEYKEKLGDAALLLEEDGYVKCFFANDKSIYAIGITIKGKLRLEQRLKTQTKPTEIELIIKDLISESNPDRPKSMEMRQTNAFYNKVNDLENAESKINFLQELLNGIEEYFIKKWTKNEKPGNYVKGYPMDFWKKTIKEYFLYKKIRRMMEKIIDDPGYVFPQKYNTYEGATRALDEYRQEYKTQNRLYWENHLFIDIIDIKKYLSKLQNDEKLEFLNFHLYELNQICYHYTDDNIEVKLKEQGLTEKFKRVKYSPYSDFTHNHISESEFRELLQLLSDNIIPFLRSEKRRLEGEKPEQTELINPNEADTNQSETTMRRDKKETESGKTRIKWEGTETQLVYLFDELIKNDFLDKELNREKYKLISEHFINKEGKDFKPKQLSVTYQNLTGKKPNKSEKIDEIISKTKTK